MINFRRFLPLLLLLNVLLAMLLMGLANPQTAALTLEIQPASVLLYPGGSSLVKVVARNGTDTPLSDLRLSAYNDLGAQVTISPDPTLPVELGPYSAVTWDVTLASDRTIRAGKVQFQLSYTRLVQTDKGSISVPAVGFASLDIGLNPVEPVENVVEVKIHATLDDLNDQSDDQLFYLELRNKSDSYLTITDLQAAPVSRHLVLKLGDPLKEQPIEPGQSRIITATLRTAPLVVSGKYPLVFNTSFEWQSGGRTQQGSLVSTREVTIGVFGESPILQVMAIPSFYLLPGVIIMLTIQVLWGVGKTREARDEYLFKPLTPHFWLFAIFGSLLMARLLYPWLTDWLLNSRRSYISGYSFDDIYYAWSLSILVGISVYAIYQFVVWLVRRVYTWILLKLPEIYVPSSLDEPLVALEKLIRQLKFDLIRWLTRAPISRRLRAVKFPLNGKEQTGYLLQPYDELRPAHWVAPRISVSLGQASPDEMGKVENALESEGNLEKLLPVLKEYVVSREKENDKNAVAWKPLGDLKRPQSVPTKDIQLSTTGEEDIIDLSYD